MAQQTKSMYDVIIIGAGYSGLSAGLYFKDCNVDNFVILEARNSVGGRVSTEIVKLDDGTQTYVDAGGAYVGPTQNRLLRLCDRFGIKTYHVYMKGKSTLEYNSKLSHYHGTVPMNSGILTLLDLNYIINETDKLAQNINPKNIHKSSISLKLLNKYDNMTVTEWLNTIATNKEAIEQYKDAVAAIVYVDPSELSLLFWLNYVRNANGSSMHLVETKNGAQDSKIIGSAQGVCDAMQKEINCKKVKLNHCVKSIEQHSDYITVSCTNSVSFTTKYVLCSIPPALYSKIEWKPSLNPMRVNISHNMPMAYIFKTNVYYKTAFWRKDGLNGLSFCCSDNKDRSPIIVTFDDCKPDGTFPSIMGLTMNKIKYMNMTKEERKQSILEQYYRIFRNKKAITECIGYFEKIWSSEIYSGGGPVGYTKCGVISKDYWNILKTNENDKIFFCGTELSDNWIGYMDGAIQSGEREANKIVKILLKHNKNIIIKNIYDFDKEPECNNCPLPFVSLQRSWIERNILPNAKYAKLCLIGLVLVILGYLFIKMT